LGVGLAFRA